MKTQSNSKNTIRILMLKTELYSLLDLDLMEALPNIFTMVVDIMGFTGCAGGRT